MKVVLLEKTELAERRFPSVTIPTVLDKKSSSHFLLETTLLLIDGEERHIFDDVNDTKQTASERHGGSVF